jgi:uncharacterized membrane protein
MSRSRLLLFSACLIPLLAQTEQIELAGRSATTVLAEGANGTVAAVREKNAMPGRYRVSFEIGVMPDDPGDNRHFNITLAAEGVERYGMTSSYRANFPADGSPLTMTRDFVLPKAGPVMAGYSWWVGKGAMTMLVFTSRLERLDQGAALIDFKARKLLVAPGEPAFVDAVVANGSTGRLDLALSVTLLREFRVRQVLNPVLLSLAPGESKPIEVPLPPLSEEYGYALVGTLAAGKTVMDARTDVFNVADNVWKVALGAPSLTIGVHSDRASRASNLQDLALCRHWYANWWERAFWAPDDWGNLNPSEARWVSGQAARFENAAMLKDFNALAKTNGIRSVTYGKHNAGGPSGWELARRHPDWFFRDQLGQPYGTFDAWALQHWNDPERFTSMEFHKRFKQNWYYLYANFTRLDVLDYGIDQLLASVKSFGWDGVRFDGHWSAGNDEMSTRNIQRMKERIWSAYPGFVFGYNDNTPHTASTDYLSSHEYRERCAGYGHIMNEQIRNYSSTGNGLIYTSWLAYAEGMLADVASIRKSGATYHCILDSRENYYKFLLCTVAGAHTDYGDHATAPGCPNWGRFLTRWSGPIWDVMLQGVPATNRVEVASSAPIWWDKWITERPVDTQTLQRIVHLIVPPASDKIPESQRSAPVTQVVVRSKLTQTGTLSGVYLLDADRGDEPVTLAAAQDGEWAQVTVPRVTGWSLVVWEFSGANERPTAPGRFTERPDPVKLAEAEKAAAKPAPKDPLHPNEDPTASGTTIVHEAEHLPNAADHADIVSDKDASNGKARRVDARCGGRSSSWGWNQYNNMPAGHYRASFRVKIEDKRVAAQMQMYAGWAGAGRSVQTPVTNVFNSDFRETGVYQDFTYEFDYPGGGTLDVSGSGVVAGKPGVLFVDCITLVLLEPHSDAKVEALRKDAPLRGDLLPGKIVALSLFDELDGLVDKAPTEPLAKDAPANPDDLAHPQRDALLAASVRVLIVNGMHADVYGLAKAFPRDWAVSNAYAGCDPDPYLKDYPDTIEGLFAYRAVVLANVDARALGYDKRRQLKQFVACGGGLYVLGGMHTLGQGSFKNTFLEELIPLEIAPAQDLQQAGKPLPLTPVRGGLATATAEQRAMNKTSSFLYWRHIVKPKATAAIHVTAGPEPVLFTGTFQKGRVAVFTGTVLGEPVGQEQPFWTWNGWPLLTATIVNWIGGNDRPTGKW